MRRTRRLNRTSVGLKLDSHNTSTAAIKDGLNRTSVGLKPTQAVRASQKVAAPQSNQRGIETLAFPFNLRHAPCLNRTSVGLKLELEVKKITKRGAPQSNQRGIETNKGDLDLAMTHLASIEPAWD